MFGLFGGIGLILYGVVVTFQTFPTFAEYENEEHYPIRRGRLYDAK
ncbi:hypothetical protein [Sporosarcina ureae]|nr:hypothetical protein [Sporosarcina ureae]